MDGVGEGRADQKRGRGGERAKSRQQIYKAWSKPDSEHPHAKITTPGY